MAVTVSDGEIASLIAEPKPLPIDYLHRVQTRPKRGHRERELEAVGASGNTFRLILRQATENVLDFSVILAWVPPQSSLFDMEGEP